MSDETKIEEGGVDQDVLADIDAMTAALSGDAPVTEGVEEGEEKLEVESEEAEEEAEEEEVEEVKDDPTALLLAKIEEMQTELRSLKAKPEEKSAEKKTTPERVDFLKGRTVDDVAKDEDSFNTLLNEIYQRATLDAEERVLRAVPNVVKSSVTQQGALAKHVEKFYTDNPDLGSFKKAVAVVAQEVAGEHPEWSVERVFSEVEKESRRRLGLVKKTVEEKKAGKRPGGFARGGSGPRSEARPQLSDLEKEIMEMNKALRQ